MKKAITTIVAMALLSFTLQAQNGHLPKMPKDPKMLLSLFENFNKQNHESASASRTLQSRLIAYSEYYYANVLSDSIHYYYHTNSGSYNFYVQLINDGPTTNKMWLADTTLQFIENAGTIMVDYSSYETAKQTIVNNQLTLNEKIQSNQGDERNRYIYNADGLISTQELDTIDGSSTWNLAYRYVYSYNANKDMTSWVAQEKQGANWVNFWQYRLTYDGNNDCTQLIYEEWNGTAWVNGGQYDVTYSSPHKKNVLTDGSYSLYYTYSGNFIAKDSANNGSMHVYTNDANGNVLISYNKEDGGGAFYYDTVYRTYNSYNQVTREWSGINVSDIQNWYYEVYDGPAAIAEADDNLKMTVSPNPIANHTVLQFELATADEVSIQLFDMTGRLVQTIKQQEHLAAGKYSLTLLDAENLSGGTYFLQFSNHTTKRTIKLLK